MDGLIDGLSGWVRCLGAESGLIYHWIDAV